MIPLLFKCVFKYETSHSGTCLSLQDRFSYKAMMALGQSICVYGSSLSYGQEASSPYLCFTTGGVFEFISLLL